MCLNAASAAELSGVLNPLHQQLAVKTSQKKGGLWVGFKSLCKQAPNRDDMFAWAQATPRAAAGALGLLVRARDQGVSNGSEWCVEYFRQLS